MGTRTHLLCLTIGFVCTIAVLAESPFYYKDLSLYRGTGKKFVDIRLSKSGRPETLRSCKSKTDDLDECLVWESSSTNKFTASRTSNLSKCIIFHVNAANDTELNSCWDMSDLHWYGGGEEKQQYWPLEGHNITDKPMVPVELDDRAVADAIWINTAGDLIFVEKGAPIFLEMNSTYKDQLCIRGNLTWPYKSRERLEYNLYYCSCANQKEALQYAFENFLSRPSSHPDERMIKYPIWSTWAQYSKDINDTAVREFANYITKNGFNNSQLEIDDNWESCYGSTEFNTTRFPNITNLTDYLHDQGFRVTLWSHPFINLNCSAITSAENNDYLVKDLDGNITTKWWDGTAGIVDFTRTASKNWWVEKHKKLMEEKGIDGMKFDAGEISWLPQLPNLNVTSSNTEDYPGIATTDYMHACAEFGNITEFRSAYYTQDLPIFLRMLDKDSLWGYDNGLKTLITTLLQMNVAGYSFILPDMIGGNAYDDDVITEQLFVRWLQANTFMPTMQFSYGPWNFNNETIMKITKKFCDLHASYSDTIITAMKKKIADSTPVNPPIWWVSPDDEIAQTIDSEFMLGENILVAPVVEDNVVERDVYLPNGTWKDGNNGTVYEGGRWLKNYPAPLDTLPYFILENTTTTSSANILNLSISLLISLLILVFM